MPEHCSVYGHISQYVVLGGEGKVDKISFREERFSPEENFMVVNIKAMHCNGSRVLQRIFLPT